jgi:glucuronate isomerase
MNYADFQRAVEDLPVYDTHTHLKAQQLAAGSVWDLAHYLWFVQELRAAGYPDPSVELSDEQRFAALSQALERSANTTWNWAFRRIFADLYDVNLDGSVASLRAADEVVRASSKRTDWPRVVCDRIGIERIVTNVEADAPYPQLPGAAVVMPRLEGVLREARAKIAGASDQRAAGAQVTDELASRMGEIKSRGRTAVMTTYTLQRSTESVRPELPPNNNDDATIGAFVLHALTAACARHGLMLQLFLGIEHVAGNATAVNECDRITNLYGLFARHCCPFELVTGCEVNNLDVVQAARIFPQVSAGALWWYNFRLSTYRQVMQYRFEGLPAGKSSLVASDARQIVWAYGKILVVKRLMAQYLFEQVQQGWCAVARALATARQWLHDSAASRYGPRTNNEATRHVAERISLDRSGSETRTTTYGQ